MKKLIIPLLSALMLLSAQVQEMMQWLHNNGCGSDDHSAILKFYQHITGVDISEHCRKHV